jgi:hypothetical protein
MPPGPCGDRVRNKKEGLTMRWVAMVVCAVLAVGSIGREASASWRPAVLSAVRFEDPAQGERTRRVLELRAIATVPVVPNKVIDRNENGVIGNRDGRRIARWVDENLAGGHTGPAILHYERPWMSTLYAPWIPSYLVGHITDVHRTGLDHARQLRPQARWGYLGLPLGVHMTDGWQAYGNSITPLLMSGDAVFPALDDCSSGDDAAEFEHQVRDTLAAVSGARPVYAVLSVRYCGFGGGRSFMPNSEVIANADAALRAAWTDDGGVTHRVAGVILWDDYGAYRERKWSKVDRKHARLLKRLDRLADEHAAAAAGSGDDGGGIAAAGPVVYDAIYYGHYRSPNMPDYAVGQGSRTAAVRESLGIGIVPMVYGHDIDRDADGVISAVDHALMLEWLDEFVPPDFAGPACLDYEHPFNAELARPSIAPSRLERILEVYAEVLHNARAARPAAQWGFWNMPMRRHVSQGWADQGLSVTSLLEQGGAIFPAAYDCQPDFDDGPAYTRYVEDALEAVRGELPVYVFLNMRYCAQGDGYQSIIPPSVVLSNAEACLAASWTGPDGRVHRAAGIVLWDCYCFADESTWDEVDQMHADLLAGLHQLTASHADVR